MVEFKDYYKVMGVARDATEAQIKQAYRKLARKYHPDVSKEKDAEARFKEVGEAYEVLKSPEKRAAYDQLGKDYRPGRGFQAAANWDSGFEFSGAGPGDSSYSDFFDALFGAQARSAPRPRPASTPAAARIITPRCCSILRRRCTAVREPSPCACPRSMPQAGSYRKERTLNVQVPKGILPGQQIRLAGQGARAAGGGKPGDLYIEVEFQPHPCTGSRAATCIWSCPWRPGKPLSARRSRLRRPAAWSN